MIIGSRLLRSFVQQNLVRTLNVNSFGVNSLEPINGNLNFNAYKIASENAFAIDSFGNIILLVNWSNNATNTLSYIVNNNGTWSFPTHTGMTNSLGELYMATGAFVYDSNQDCLHSTYIGSSVDRIVYRRYSIIRDINNNIVEISRDLANDNIRLDFANGNPIIYENCFIHLNQTEIMVFWSIRNTASNPKGEIRSSKRILSYDNNDFVHTNWQALGQISSTTINQSPDVEYTALVTKAASARNMAFSIHFDNTTCYVIYTDGEITPLSIFGKSFAINTFNVITDEVFISNGTLNGNNTGDQNKHYRISKLVSDGTKLYFASAFWDNTEVWNIVKIDKDFTNVNFINVFTANVSDTSNSDFIHGDLIYLNNALITVYTSLPNKTLNYALLQNDEIKSFGTIYNNVFGFTNLNILNENTIYISGRNYNIEAINNPPIYAEPFDLFVGELEIT